jgi:hypothetical protein
MTIFPGSPDPSWTLYQEHACRTSIKTAIKISAEA